MNEWWNVRRNGEVANCHSRYKMFIRLLHVSKSCSYTRWNTYFIYGRARERNHLL